MSSDGRCCERDTDGDGNCDRHPAGLEKQRAAETSPPPTERNGNGTKRPKRGDLRRIGGSKTREHGVVVLKVDGQDVRFDLTMKPGKELTEADKAALIELARKVRTEAGASAEKGEEFEGSLHRCHAKGCEEHVHPKYLMCAKHWRMVPLEIKQRVLHAYRMGQERTKKPSRAYAEAAGEAVRAVAFMERR